MGKIAWNEDYTMGSKVIDVHHQQLIDYINQLDEVIDGGYDKEFLMSIVERLLEYTDYHFSAEEKYMKEYEYPELQAHCEEHKAFIDEIKKIKKMIEDDVFGVDAKIVSYLKKWFIHHILIIDKEYSVFFESKGIHLP